MKAALFIAAVLWLLVAWAALVIAQVLFVALVAFGYAQPL